MAAAAPALPAAGALTRTQLWPWPPAQGQTLAVWLQARQPVSLTVTLPISEFYTSDCQHNEANIQRKIDNLLRPVTLNKRETFTNKVSGLWPSLADFKRMLPAVFRGTSLGSILGILPGGGAVLSSLFSAGYQISQRPRDNIDKGLSSADIAAAAVGMQVSQVGARLIDRNLAIQPTLEIRPGYRFNIRVNKDMLFAGPYKDLPPLSK